MVIFAHLPFSSRFWHLLREVLRQIWKNRGDGVFRQHRFITRNAYLFAIYMVHELLDNEPRFEMQFADRRKLIQFLICTVEISFPLLPPFFITRDAEQRRLWCILHTTVPGSTTGRKTVISTAVRHLHEHILHNDPSIKHRTRTRGTHVDPIEPIELN